MCCTHSKRSLLVCIPFSPLWSGVRGGLPFLSGQVRRRHRLRAGGVSGETLPQPLVVSAVSHNSSPLPPSPQPYKGTDDACGALSVSDKCTVENMRIYHGTDYRFVTYLDHC
jgi:hypothetical protein